ncbi:MAG TPA: hypothetical protein VI299_05025 [Polyangiales bacterium]
MRRLLFLVPLMLVGCATGYYQGLLRGDVWTHVQLRQLSNDMDEVKDKLDHPVPVRQLAPPSASPVYQRPRDGRLSTRVVFAGGHLQLIGVPQRSRDEVVLAFRPTAVLDETCDVKLYRDDDRLSTGEQLRYSDHELRVVLRIDDLGTSRRFAGVACGRRFELDQAGRDTIAGFVERFQEGLDALPGPPPTQVAAAR